MPPTYYETLLEERETLSGTIEQTVTSAQDNGGLRDDDKTKITGMQKRVADIDAELTILVTEQDSLRKANEFAAKFMRPPRPAAEERSAKPEHTTLGEAFIASDEWKGYEGHGNSRKFEFRDGEDGGGAEYRAALLTTDFPATIGKTRVSVLEPTAQFPLFGVVNLEQVGTGSFEYVTYALVNNAAVVPEGTPKPESDITETVTPGTLDTIAHWVQVTRQALEDSARIRSIIDGKLTEGVQRKVHDSIVAALAAAALPAASSDALLKSIRVGIGTVQAAGFNPNAVLLNPADWAELDIAVMGGTLNGPQRSASFWGLTPVASIDQPAGTATVGDFKAGVDLFYRAGVGVYATDSHGDSFTSNIFTILAERRTKAAVVNPNALAECTVVVGP